MKLTPHELRHATEEQLAALDIFNTDNAGWSERAAEIHWTDAEEAAFRAAAEVVWKIELTGPSVKLTIAAPTKEEAIIMMTEVTSRAKWIAPF